MLVLLRRALLAPFLAAVLQPKLLPALANKRSVDDYTTSRGLEQQQPVTPKESFEKLPSGVRFATLKVGDRGEPATAGARVSMQWVLRRSNGYFVDSSLGAFASGPGGGTLSTMDKATQFDPFVFTVGSGAAIAGLDEAVRGMRIGGIRRVIVPVAQGYTLPVDVSAGPVPGGFGPRRQLERELNKADPYNYFFFEIEITNVR
jgi:hypothetical protein